ADVNFRTEDNETPLQNAARGNHPDVIRELVAANADVNSREIDQWTPLMMASRTGNLAAVETLLCLGADVDAVDNEGNAASWHARIFRHFDVSDMIEKGCPSSEGKQN
ncbi:MAG: ankyrin repeat domain-containing protein, partial [Rhodothermales bacterium]|nr:ankyrin repeat domain-containing protein [Rhodothermales bacterium]